MGWMIMPIALPKGTIQLKLKGELKMFIQKLKKYIIPFLQDLVGIKV